MYEHSRVIQQTGIRKNGLYQPVEEEDFTCGINHPQTGEFSSKSWKIKDGYGQKIIYCLKNFKVYSRIHCDFCATKSF